MGLHYSHIFSFPFCHTISDQVFFQKKKNKTKKIIKSLASRATINSPTLCNTSCIVCNYIFTTFIILRPFFPTQFHEASFALTITAPFPYIYLWIIIPFSINIFSAELNAPGRLGGCEAPPWWMGFSFHSSVIGWLPLRAANFFVATWSK